MSHCAFQNVDPKVIEETSQKPITMNADGKLGGRKNRLNKNMCNSNREKHMWKNLLQMSWAKSKVKAAGAVMQ